jgi:hypothetical protein
MPVPLNNEIKVAFALGGLAGNNAHGAGFLQAALDVGIRPALISCTSGQILWVTRYLDALQLDRRNANVLRDDLAKDIAELEKFHQPDLDIMTLALFGKPSIMRPARHEYLLDLIKNYMKVLEKTIQEWPNIFVMRELFSELPARSLVPLFTEQFFQRTSDIFNASDIGIMFNSYDPVQGMEIVHLNPKAQSVIDKNPGDKSRHRSRTIYKSITPQYVRDGLWIYQYGFEQCAMLDGAFYRDVMLWELKQADDIYVARPVKYKWLGALPSSFIEMEDMKTEVFFNGSYQGERDKLMLLEKLRERVTSAVAEGNTRELILSDPYMHCAKLHEIEIESQESFYDYIFEDLPVFDRSRDRSRLALTGKLPPEIYAVEQ